MASKRAKQQKPKKPAKPKRKLSGPQRDADGLVPMQRLFCKEFMVDLNAAQAAIRAGYSPKTAKEMGYENLTKPHIMAVIDRAMAEHAGITRTRLIQELGAMAFSDIRKVVHWDQETELAGGEFGDDLDDNPDVVKVIKSRVTVLPGATMDPMVAATVAEISQGEKGQLKVKMHDKVAAIDKLARAMGLYQDKIDVTSGGEPIVPVLNYTGAPPKILARKLGHAPPSEAVGGDGDEGE